MKKIFISSDHAGFKLKETIKVYLRNKKIKFEDLGPKDISSVDYPDYAHKVARKVKLNKSNYGILVCGSGTGMNIAANKHKNIRAAQCFNIKSTKLSRLHNDANIITLGSRLITKKNALRFVGVFLNTKFDGGRHLRRIKKI
ncbi:ribose 5-phosphate isomerase B [Candidatus Pelagibacter sp.]|nr:ribose 5-phosphate isomerase B [Candidatus Pelagibacter sp.]